MTLACVNNILATFLIRVTGSQDALIIIVVGVQKPIRCKYRSFTLADNIVPKPAHDLYARYVAVASVRMFLSLDLLSLSLTSFSFPGMSFFKLDMVEELRIDASSADIRCFSSKVQ